MEKTITKTIREAFKKAYINKILKEGAEDLAKKLNPEMLLKAESLYNLWISGKKTIKYGNLPQDTFNYILEKAIEEYKQTKNDKIRNAVAIAFYPEKGSKILGRLKHGSPYMNQVYSALRKARGESISQNELEEEIDDLISEAWIEALGTKESFDELIDMYKTEGKTGIGALIFTKIANAIRAAAMFMSAKKRGGGLISHRFGDSPEGSDEYEKKLKGAEDFLSPENKGEEDFGSDIRSSEEVDLTDSEIDGDEKNSINRDSIADSLSADKLKNTFFELKNILQNDEKMNPRVKAILMGFFNGKKPSETYAENTEYFSIPGKNEQQIRNEITAIPTVYFSPKKGDKKASKYFDIADNIGKENGLPEGWLNFILEKKKFIEIAKFIKQASSMNLQESESNAKIKQILSEIDVDMIIKEVYKIMKNM